MATENYYQKGTTQPLVVSFTRFDGGSPVITNVKCRVETYNDSDVLIEILSLADMTHRTGTNEYHRLWAVNSTLSEGLYFVTYTYTLDGIDGAWIDMVRVGSGVVSVAGGGAFPVDYLRFDDPRLELLEKLLTSEEFRSKIVVLEKFPDMMKILNELEKGVEEIDVNAVYENIDGLKVGITKMLTDMGGTISTSEIKIGELKDAQNNIPDALNKSRELIMAEMSKFNKSQIEKLTQVDKANLDSVAMLQSKMQEIEGSMKEKQSKMSKESIDGFQVLKNMVSGFHKDMNAAYEARIKATQEQFAKMKKDMSDVDEKISKYKEETNVMLSKFSTIVAGYQEKNQESFKEIGDAFVILKDNLDTKAGSDSVKEEFNAISQIMKDVQNTFVSDINDLNNAIKKNKADLDSTLAKKGEKRDILHLNTQLRDRMSKVKYALDLKLKKLQRDLTSAEGNLGSKSEDINTEIEIIKRKMKKIRRDAELNEDMKLLEGDKDAE